MIPSTRNDLDGSSNVNFEPVNLVRVRDTPCVVMDSPFRLLSKECSTIYHDCLGGTQSGGPFFSPNSVENVKYGVVERSIRKFYIGFVGGGLRDPHSLQGRETRDGRVSLCP